MKPGRRQTNFDCPMRDVVDRVGDAWSLMVLLELSDAPMRFCGLSANIDGISHRMLSVTLRRLERDGLVSRAVSPSNKPHAIYTLTELGRPMIGGINSLRDWASASQPAIHAARAEFDQKPPAQ